MTSALVVGGTGFVGRHTAAEFLDHGHTVTALSRGTVAESVASGRDGSAFDPGRDAEARLLETLTAE